MQQTLMHSCAHGPDTLQGFASESWWIAHSLMQKCAKSERLRSAHGLDPTPQCMQAKTQQIPMHPTCKWAGQGAGVLHPTHGGLHKLAEGLYWHNCAKAIKCMHTCTCIHTISQRRLWSQVQHRESGAIEESQGHAGESRARKGVRGM